VRAQRLPFAGGCGFEFPIRMLNNVIFKNANNFKLESKSMKNRLYKVYKNVLAEILVLINFLITKLPRGRFASSLGLQKIWDVTLKSKVNNKYLYFHIPNWLAFYRAKTLLTKEPETIAWLNNIRTKSVIYDIGSNVGMYSIYAAAVRDCKVISFEPSFLNLELLFRNVQTNNLQDKITIVPLSLSNESQIENFYMQEGDNIWGGAHNSSGSNISQDGTEMLNFKISSQLALSLDALVEIFRIPKPDHIKIDIDGLESKVLKGGLKTFGNSKSILIEIDAKNQDQSSEVQAILTKLGFVKLICIGKIELMENQIWVKPGWEQ
jgi:FkbM family methyltransferase